MNEAAKPLVESCEPVKFTERQLRNFWKKVDKRGPDECWPWTGYRQHQGYGRFGIGRTIYRAHRLAWIIAFGQIPDKLWVLHTCDNPPCCNSTHLWLGTRLDNIQDCVRKGRNKAPVMFGTLNPRARLTEELVHKIRAEYIPLEMGVRMLARKYGVGRHCIRGVLTGETWIHVS